MAAALALILSAVAACGGTTDGSPGTSGEPTAASATPTEAPTDAPSPSVEPTSTPEPTADTSPTASASAAASAGTGVAAACTGSDENREFYAQAAAAIDFAVYCPVLPRGWFVDSGRYRSSGGGWLEIAYRGPSDARLELREGSFCDDDDGCVESGTDVGATAFGDVDGTLVELDDGGYTVVVDRGASPTWVLTITGVDEAEAREIAAALHLVA
jgi:hypothetical protein